VDRVELIETYEGMVDALARELDATRAGDSVRLSFYLLEPGRSSERVLEAAGAAAARGASVELSVDATIASRLSRLVERTGTLMPRARALAEAFPTFRAVERVRTMDHAKYAVFSRAERPLVLVGGMNLGDRFAAWRDYSVVAEGAEVVRALERAVSGEAAAARETPVDFVANVPRARWDILPAFEALARDPRLVRYRVAMAYLDRAGARVLRLALDRGASVELVLPARANVYQHSNLRTLSELLRSGRDVRAWLSRPMLHAKGLLAWDRDGPSVAFLGSANLKRNSFHLFGELNAIVREPGFLSSFASALDVLLANSDPVATLSWSGLRAAFEERLG
jgi:phosphatidylserine/phosphatidylglycerophosphate/cardiolipin synthase-like enzyme